MKPRPVLKRALRYTPAKWRAFDRIEIDPNNAEQTGLVAAINANRAHAAIKAVGNRAGDIRKYLAR